MKKLGKIELKFMPFGNRQVSARQVSLLKTKIIKSGIMRAVQVVYTNKFGEGFHHYIKDGQHLFTACQSLEILEELFIVVDKHDYKTSIEIVQDVASINSDQKGWRLGDFINSYASTNQLLDYNVLLNKCISYGLSYQLTAMIYGGLSSISSSKVVKAGEFKILDIDKGDKICKILQDVVLIFGRSNNIFLRHFTFAFYNWFNSINYIHQKFLLFVRDNKKEMALLKENDIEVFLQKFNK